MKRVIITYVVIFLCLALVLGFAIAQTNNTDNNSTNPDQNASNNESNGSDNNQTDNNQTSDNNQSGGSNQTGNWSKVCSATNNRVGGRIKMYEDNRDPHLNRFKNIVKSLEKVINISKSKGYDTIDLEADLETLNAMIKKFQDDYSLFVQKLKDTRNYTCGHSEGRFKQALKDAKDQLKIVRQDMEDIKEFIKETIKEDIKQIRQQRKEDVQNKIRERLNKTGEDMKQLKEKIEERLNKTGEKAEQLRERMNERLNMANKIRNR